MVHVQDHKHKGVLNVQICQARQIKKPFFAALTGSCICELRTPNGKILETAAAQEVAGELVWNESFMINVEPGALLTFQLDVVFRGPLHVSALAGRIAIDYDKMLEEGRYTSDKWFFIYKGDAEESGAVHLVLRFDKEGASRGNRREREAEEPVEGAGEDGAGGGFGLLSPAESPLKRRAKGPARGEGPHALPTARGSATDRSAVAERPEWRSPRSLEGMAPPPGAPPRQPPWAEQAGRGKAAPGDLPPAVAPRQIQPLQPLPLAERERLESKAASVSAAAAAPGPPLTGRGQAGPPLGPAKLKLPPIAAVGQRHAEEDEPAPPPEPRGDRAPLGALAVPLGPPRPLPPRLPDGRFQPVPPPGPPTQRPQRV